MFESLLNPDILAELIKQVVKELWDIWNILENPYKWWLAIWVLWIWPLWKIFKWLKLEKWKEDEKNDMLDIVDWISNYIDKYLYTILRLWRIDSLNLKDNLSVLRKKMENLVKQSDLEDIYVDNLLWSLKILKNSYSNLIN